MQEMLDILVFAPHPDDGEIGCGGMLALANSKGLKTGIVDMTAGEAATRGTPAWDQAMTRLCAEIDRVRDEHGGEAITPFNYGGSNGYLTDGLVTATLYVAQAYLHPLANPTAGERLALICASTRSSTTRSAMN